jgi:hypothetical protein
MLTGHQSVAWIHTTHLLVTLANQNRGKDDKPLKFDDVYPFGAKAKASKERESDELDKVLEAAAWSKLAKQQGRK